MGKKPLPEGYKSRNWDVWPPLERKGEVPWGRWLGLGCIALPFVGMAVGLALKAMH